MRSLVLTLTLGAVVAACSETGSQPAQAEPQSALADASTEAQAEAPAADPALDRAIATVLGEDAASTRTVIRVIGEDAGRLALVYLVGMNWCGSGGCNLLILRPTADGWETVGNVGRARPPIRVLATRTNGLPDIGVTVSGGGGPPAYEAKLSFDGETYPRFPSDEPLVGAEGEVVITDADIPPPAA